MGNKRRFTRTGARAGALAAGALLLVAGCAGGDGDGGGSAREAPASPKPSSRSDGPRKDGKVARGDDPNLLRGFRSWLASHDAEHDDALARHALNVRLDYRSGSRAGVVEVLTDYGPWGRAEAQVGPLAKAFTQWWDGDPAAADARFLGQGGKTAGKAALYEGDEPSNLLARFRSWTAAHSPDGDRLAPHLTGLSIGYGAKGAGAVTVSTDYRTREDPGTPRHVDALGDAFVRWWDGDAGAGTVTVTSEDQGSRAERTLTRS